MPESVVTRQQVEYQRMLKKKLDTTQTFWKEHFHWIPVDQLNSLDRIGQIYAESRQKYGDDMFKVYAKRNRLWPKYALGEEETKQTKAISKEETQSTEETQKLKAESEACQEYYYGKSVEYPATTNGEYGWPEVHKIYYLQ